MEKRQRKEGMHFLHEPAFGDSENAFKAKSPGIECPLPTVTILSGLLWMWELFDGFPNAAKEYIELWQYIACIFMSW